MQKKKPGLRITFVPDKQTRAALERLKGAEQRTAKAILCRLLKEAAARLDVRGSN